MNKLKLKFFVRALMVLLLVCVPLICKAEGERPGDIEVELVGSNETDKDRLEVVAALQKLLKGLAHRDLALIERCLSDDVTLFDDKSRTFLFGKTTVLDHVKKNVVGIDSTHPVKRIVVYHPFVNVKGDTAMVSFRATKVLSDKASTTMESWCAEIFERRNGEWLVLQLKTDWLPVKRECKKVGNLTRTKGDECGQQETTCEPEGTAKSGKFRQQRKRASVSQGIRA